MLNKYKRILVNCLPKVRKDRISKPFFPWIWTLQILNVTALQEKSHVLVANILVPCVMHKRNVVTLVTFLSPLYIPAPISYSTRIGPGPRNWRSSNLYIKFII